MEFDAEGAKTLRSRPECSEDEANGYETKAKILALRPIWPQCLNISVYNNYSKKSVIKYNSNTGGLT